MVTRLLDPLACREVTDKYPDYFTFNAEAWFSNPLNFAFQEGENIGFGEWKAPGIYWVHFCFHTARGREAINLTRRMFKALCAQSGLVAAIGPITIGNRKARWLIRQVGFTSLGAAETPDTGLCEIFYATPSIVEDLDE